MRGRLSFALAAVTLLFLLQGLSSLLTIGFSTAASALAREVRPAELLPLLLLLLALAASAVPLSPIVERRSAVAGAAIVTAVARMALATGLPALRLAATALIVAAGAVFLSAAIGYLERRSVAGGLGAAIVLQQLFRFAGSTWDITLRPGWILPQLVLSVAVISMAIAWLRSPEADPEPHETGSSLERRAGGLRLRGGIALAMLLFLDLNVLARADTAARWLGVSYDVAAVVLILAGTAATLVLLAAPGPFGRHRPAAVGLAVVAAGAALAAGRPGGLPGLALFAGGHAAALLLMARALVPASGRRKGGILAGALFVWLLFTVLYASAQIRALAAFVPPHAAAWLFASAGALLVLLLILLPRPVAITPPLRGRTGVATPATVILVAVLSLYLRAPGDPAPASRHGSGAPPGNGGLTLATRDMGHMLDGRPDADRLLEPVAMAAPDLLVLYGTGSMPFADGMDPAIYIARTSGAQVRFPAGGGHSAGPALVSWLRDLDLGHRAAHGGAFERLAVPVGDDTVLVLIAQAAALADAPTAAEQVRTAAGPRPAVLLTDVDRQPAMGAVLERAGFNAVFTGGRTRGMRRPADRVPAVQAGGWPDRMRVRGLGVVEARVYDIAGPDGEVTASPVLSATLRPVPPIRQDSAVGSAGSRPGS